jgi:hypothetical protein
MKIFKQIPVFAVALLLLPGCQKEAPGGSGLPMRIEASLAEETKGSLTTDSLTDFFVQITCSDDQSQYNYSGKVIKKDGKWSSAQPVLWKDKTTPVTYVAARFGLHAFTPEEFTDGVDLSVPDDQSTQAKLDAADLVFKPFTSVSYNQVSGVLSFPFQHMLTRLNIILTLGPGFYENGYGQSTSPVTGFTVKGSDTGFKFNPSATVSKVSVISGTQADIVPLTGNYTPGTADSKSSTANYEAILVPQELAAGALKVTFKVGIFGYEWSNAVDLTLSPGQSYTLELDVTDAPAPSNP